MNVRSAEFAQYRRRHSLFLNTSRLEERSNISWVKRIPSLGKDYAPFPTVDILNMRGIPPLMGSPGGPNTKSALIKVIIELLKNLPPASNILEGEEQVKTTLRFVYQAGVQSRVMNHINELGNEFIQNAGSMFSLEGALAHCEKIEATTREIPYFGYDAPFMQSLTFFTDSTGKEIFLAKSYISHGLIIGRNGAIQIIRIPSAEQLIKLLENDKRAKQYILENQPLDKDENNGISPVFFGDETELFSHLRNEELLRERVTAGRDFDVNKLFRSAPFDLPRHIKAGRLKVILDKVGADGLTVWQNTRDDFYKALSKLDKERKERITKLINVINAIISSCE